VRKTHNARQAASLEKAEANELRFDQLSSNRTSGASAQRFRAEAGLDGLTPRLTDQMPPRQSRRGQFPPVKPVIVHEVNRQIRVELEPVLKRLNDLEVRVKRNTRQLVDAEDTQNHIVQINDMAIPMFQDLADRAKARRAEVDRQLEALRRMIDTLRSCVRSEGALQL
jgi:hypothetical protein